MLPGSVYFSDSFQTIKCKYRNSDLEHTTIAEGKVLKLTCLIRITVEEKGLKLPYFTLLGANSVYF